MTENIAPEAAPVETDENATASTGNPLLDGLIALAREKADLANVEADKVSNAKGNFAKSIKEARDNSTDPEIVEYREWEQSVYAEINRRRGEVDKKLAAAMGGEAMSADEIAESEEKHKAYSEDARQAWKTVLSMGKMLGVDITTPEPEYRTLAGRTGTLVREGGRRFRFDDVTVNGESVKSLSKAALLITQKSGVKTTAKDLQEAIIDSAKTDDAEALNGYEYPYTTTKDEKTTTFDLVLYKAAAAPATTEAPATENATETTESNVA